MGPGIAVKAILQSSFSLMIFGWAQIVMDIQPLIVLLSGEGHLHGFSHTYIGATLLAVFSGLTGKYLVEVGLAILLGNQLQVSKNQIAWWVVFLSAFIGTYSHVLIDSVMHADMEPLSPFFADNQLLGVISVASLHKFCLYSGLVGSIVYFGINGLKHFRKS